MQHSARHTPVLLLILLFTTSIMTWAAPARSAFVPEPLPCEVRSSSMTPDYFFLEEFGDRAALELVVEVYLDGVCKFDNEWIELQASYSSGDIGNKTSPLLLEPTTVEVLDENPERRQLRYHSAAIARGPGSGVIVASYAPTENNVSELEHRATFDSTAEAPAEAGCFAMFGQYSPLSTLFDHAGDSTDFELEVEVYDLGVGSCEFVPGDVVVALEISSGGGMEDIFFLEEAPPEIVVETPEYLRYRYRATVTAAGSVGSAALVASYADAIEPGKNGNPRRRAQIAYADLVPRAMALDAGRLRSHAVSPEPPPPGEDPYVTLELDLTEAEYDDLASRFKDWLVLEARDAGQPGGVVRVLEVGEPWPGQPGRVIAEITAQSIPVAAAFEHYDARLQTEPMQVPLHDNPAGEPQITLKGAGEGGCEVGNNNQFFLEFVKLTGNFFEVTPELSLQIVDGELRQLRFVAHQITDFQLEGPKVVINGTFGGLQAECTLELLEIDLPFPLVSGPFTFNPTVSAEVGVTMEALAGGIDVQIKSFTLKYRKTESLGFDWRAGKEAEPIKESSEPVYEANWDPALDIKAQTLDLAMKFAPFVQLRLGVKARFIGVELGTLKLINVRSGLETTVRLPVWTFLTDAPSPDYENPEWKVEAAINVTVAPSFEWGPYMKKMGAEDWESSFPPINLITLSLLFGQQPTPVLTAPSSSFYLGEPIPVTATLKGFQWILDRAMYEGNAIDFYARKASENDWGYVDTLSAQSAGADLAATLDLTAALDEPGTWKVIAVVREPLVDDLQFPVLTVEIDGFEGAYTPDSFHLSAGLEMSVEDAIKIFNPNPSTDLIYRFNPATIPGWITGLPTESTPIAPDAAASQTFTATCGTTAERRDAILELEYAPAGGGFKVGEIDVALYCRSFTVTPQKLSFEMPAGQTQDKYFTVTNQTGGALSIVIDMTERRNHDATDPTGTVPVAAGASVEVKLTAKCDKPGTREGWVTVSHSTEPWAIVYTEIECQPESGDGSGGSAGDPHFTTFDGKRYDFQGRGEYVLALYDDAGYGFEVQSRQMKASPTSTKNVTLNKAVALDVDGVAVSFYSQGAGNEVEVHVDGTTTPIADLSTVDLGGGRSIERRGSTYWVAWPAMSGGGQPFVVVRDHETFLNLQIYPPGEMAGSLRGLLGDFDGNPHDEPFLDSSGKDPIDPDSVYCFDPGCFAYGSESWLVGTASLFDYAPGEGPEDYTPQPGDPIPTDEPTIDDFTPAEVQWAVSICLGGGVIDVLEPCVIDILVTGDPKIGLANAELAVPPSVWRTQTPYLEDQNGGDDDEFGVAVAVAGDVLAVGTDNDYPCPAGHCPDVGSLMIYERVAGEWGPDPVQEVVHDTTKSYVHFGAAVAVHQGPQGATIFAAAPQENGNGPSSGVLYRYEKPGSSWQETTILNPDKATIGDEPDGDSFGSAIAVSDTHLVVGAPGDDELCGTDNNCNWTGAVFVLEHADPNAAWTKLKPPAKHPYAFYGKAVALDGDLLAVGAPEHEGEGKVYVYRWDGLSWALESAWTANGGDFGHALALDNELLAVGAPDEADESGQYPGAVHVYRRQGTGSWVEESFLMPVTSDDGHSFGEAVALEGARLAVGAPGLNDDGQLYVYDARPGAPEGWSPAFVLDLPASPAAYALGQAVSLSDGDLVVGSPGATVDTDPRRGRVYVLGMD